ncbi:GNAT family N-acetyltransferase [Vibrio parahaemolyticus]|nr:GNAT family N-acetyltransferase [Vibrio parahaemolyticus]HCE2175526.1 GNAT family N-acetyltransferase [Vibrio parahaemolyticus]
MDGNDEQFTVKVERYSSDSSYDFAGFDCTVESFNQFLTEGKIDKELERKISIPYVCLAVRNGKPPKVIGYFTLASSCLERRLYPVSNNQRKKFLYNTVPTVVIGKLAVCKSVQGQGVGKKLLSHAIKTAYLSSKDVGCLALYLKALNENAADFYRSCGWIEIQEEPNSFVFPLKQYEELLKNQSKKVVG